MYRPAAFAIDDDEVLDSFLDAYPFAVVISEGASVITHVPVLRQGADMLVCHLARPNPHCVQLAAGVATTVVFTGPHGYVSPRWYAASRAVPTWNYTAVHVTATPEEVEDAATLRQSVDVMVDRFEPAFGVEAVVTPATIDGMLRGIRGFRLRVRSRKGIFKLSQNRSDADQTGVVERLVQLGGSDAELARFMRDQSGLAV